MYNRIAQLVASLLPVICVSSLYGAEFRILGKLRPTDQFSDAYEVSADGSTVVGISHTGTWFEAVRWTFPRGIESLGLGQPSQAYGASFDGSVIAGYRPVEMGQVLGEPVRWTATGVLGLGDLPGGLIGGDARDVSADGSVVVGSSSSARGGEAFRWTAGTGLVGLGLMPGSNLRTLATAVSADGAVIVGSGRTVPDPDLGEQAFRWSAQTGIVGLGDLPGGVFFSEAFDVSADGSVVVGRSATDRPDYFAFRWSESTGMVELPPTADGVPFRSAEAVSGDGNVIVGPGAFVWDEFHGTRVLADIVAAQGVDLDGWTLDVARGVSHDGLTVVGAAGRGPGPGRESAAFIVRLDPGTFVPEPSSLILGAMGLLSVLVIAARWRHQSM
jgi:probable HAF family extracellular repeat protein